MQEAVAVGQNFEDALAVHQAVLADARLLEDSENGFLLFEGGIFGDAVLLGHFVEFGDTQLLKVCKVQLPFFTRSYFS